VRFWDASALVPLFFTEASSPVVNGLRQQDGDIHAWWGSRVECASMIARLARERHLDAAGAAQARAALQRLWGSIREIEPTDVVRT
jgi:predicted nucleic acid-binding protein